MDDEMYKKYELIKIIQEYEKKNSRAPKFRELKCRHSIVRAFGSFNLGLVAAKCPTFDPHQPQYTKEKLIELVRQKALLLHRTPRKRDCYFATTVLKYFGSWNKCLREADLPLNQER